MQFFSWFHIGAGKILAGGHSVTTRVEAVGRSYLYVVKKPVRLYVHERNTMTSHWIHFHYTVNGIRYPGRLWISLRYRCPQKGEQIQVFYDPENPERYACYPFGPNPNPIGW